MFTTTGSSDRTRTIRGVAYYRIEHVRHSQHRPSEVRPQELRVPELVLIEVGENVAVLL